MASRTPFQQCWNSICGLARYISTIPILPRHPADCSFTPGALQLENDKVNQLLSRLKSVSHADALRILDLIRDGQDVASTVEFAASLPAPDGPAERLISAFRGQNVVDGALTPVPYGGFSSDASIALDLNGGLDRLDRVSSSHSRPPAFSSGITLPPLSSLMYVGLFRS
jgi:hypothetical protein